MLSFQKNLKPGLKTILMAQTHRAEYAHFCGPKEKEKKKNFRCDQQGWWKPECQREHWTVSKQAWASYSPMHKHCFCLGGRATCWWLWGGLPSFPFQVLALALLLLPNIAFLAVAVSFPSLLLRERSRSLMRQACCKAPWLLKSCLFERQLSWECSLEGWVRIHLLCFLPSSGNTAATAYLSATAKAWTALFRVWTSEIISHIDLSSYNYRSWHKEEAHC